MRAQLFLLATQKYRGHYIMVWGGGPTDEEHIFLYVL